MFLSVGDRLQRLKSIAEDIQGEDRLSELLINNENFIAYNGFEPSNYNMLAQFFTYTINANIISEAYGTMIIYIADVFAQLNQQCDGEFEKIHTTGLYFI